MANETKLQEILRLHRDCSARFCGHVLRLLMENGDGKAEEKTITFGIGAGYLFKTTFQREATSDLTGERGSLMGAIVGLLEAQPDCREKLNAELEAMRNKEMWQAGVTVRKLRPENN